MLNFTVVFNESNLNFGVKFGEILRYEVLVGDLKAYDGSYSIVPTVDGQTLKTARKLMEDDLIIQKIPYYNVGNTAGGSTVYIADKLE